MASRCIATVAFHLLAVGVDGRRSQDEQEFPTSALKAVGTIVGAAGPHADPNAAQPKAVQLAHRLPGQMPGEKEPFNPWNMDLDLAYQRHQAKFPGQKKNQAFKRNAFAKSLNTGVPLDRRDIFRPERSSSSRGPEAGDRRPAGLPSVALSDPAVSPPRRPALSDNSLSMAAKPRDQRPAASPSTAVSDTSFSMAATSTVIVADSPKKVPSVPVDGKITTVYWNICGLGQPIRYALELAGADYVDVRVEPGPGAPGKKGFKKMWFDRKRELDKSMVFTNLPYLLDGDLKLVQSNAILRYIGRKYGLMGDPSAAHLVDLVLDEATDFDNEITSRCYSNFASLLPYFNKELARMLQHWTRLLGSKQFMAGDSVTVADLKIYETLRKLQLIEEQPEIGTTKLREFPALIEYMSRVEGLPALQAYRKKESFMARPLNNVHAQFK